MGSNPSAPSGGQFTEEQRKILDDVEKYVAENRMKELRDRARRNQSMKFQVAYFDEVKRVKRKQKALMERNTSCITFR